MELDMEARLYAVEKLAVLSLALHSQRGAAGIELLRAWVLSELIQDGPILGRTQARVEALDRLLAMAQEIAQARAPSADPGASTP